MSARRKDDDVSKTNVSFNNYDEFIDQIQTMIQKDYASIALQKSKQYTYCPTGSTALDYIITNKVTGGGWPFGKIVEIYGNNSTGKSLLAQLALISVMSGKVKVGDDYIPGVGMLIDTEHSFNEQFFEQLGGNPNKLFLVERHKKTGDKDKNGGPITVEAVYEMMERFINVVRAKDKNVPIVIAWDSLASTPTQTEIDNGMRKADMGKRAIAHGKGMRRLTEILANHNVLLLIVNQLRATMAMWGPDKESVGGEAVKYAASLRVHIKKGKRIYESSKGFTIGSGKGQDLKNLVGVQGVIQIEKTRFTAPFRQIQFDLFFRGGIDPFSGAFETWTDWYKDTNIFKPSIKASNDNEDDQDDEQDEQNEQEDNKKKKTKKIRNWEYTTPDGDVVVFKKNSFKEFLAGHRELQGVYNFGGNYFLPDENEIEFSEEDDTEEETPTSEDAYEE